MIKSFEQFINENYNENVVITTMCEEYGAPLFNEVSESLMYELNDSINEGRLVIDANMIEESIFGKIGNFFKKKAENIGGKIEQNADELNDLTGQMKSLMDASGRVGENAKLLSMEIDEKEIAQDIYIKIENLYKTAEEICTGLAEKEESMYKTVSEKMTAANEAIKEFTEKSIAIIKEIFEVSKNKISEAYAAVVLFCKKMAEFAKKAMEVIGKGTVLAFCLPFIFAFSVYKAISNGCSMMVEKAKEGAKVVKEAFIKIKDAIVNWAVESFKNVKQLLIDACKAVKDGAIAAYKAIGKAYLAVVAFLGQLVSEAKEQIIEAFNSFVEGIKEFKKEVQAYISEKWEVVTNWYKKTKTAFAEGVKNIWEKTKEKVKGVVDSISDAYKTLKDNAKATWEDVKQWSSEKKKAYYMDVVKYTAEKYGKDEVSSWINEE